MSERDAFVARLDAGPDAPPLATALPDATGTWSDGPLELAWRGGRRTDAALVAGRITNLDLEAALRDEGHEVVRRCRGQFALLVWDAQTRRGLAARDPLGHRGLVYALRGRTLLLATDPRFLLPLLPSRPAPDDVAVAHWLAGTGVPVGRTLFAGIQRLPPGHVLPLGEPAPRPRRVWRPVAGEPAYRAPDEAAAVLRDAMAAAVARSLDGAAEPAVLLSGGFDSGAVAALAGARLPAYSVVFPGRPEVDESDAIAATRAACGLDGVERRFAAGGALGASLEYLLHHELPPPSPNAFLWRPLLRRAAADGATVMLDGEGGDEVLGCAPMLLADRLRRGDVPGALRLARRIPGMGADPRAIWMVRALRHGLRGALPHGPHQVLRHARGRGRGLEGDWLREKTRALHDETHDRWTFKREAGPRWAAALLDVVGARAEALGAHDHFRREAELAGLELRHPLRDPELLETVLAIDPALSFDPDLDRPLARRAMAGALPDAVRLATRKPDFNPILRQALAIDREPVGALLGPGARVRAYVREDVLDARLAEPPDRLRDRDLLMLWRVAALESWLRLDGERGSLERLRASRPAPDDDFAAATVTVRS